MRAREFAFWLQGYFEINGTDAALTPAQAKTVLAKAEKTDLSGADAADQKAAVFVSYAKGALASVNYVQPADQQSVLKGVTDKLRSDLNDLFIHAIDPTLPGDQQKHRDAHRPADKPGLIAMC